MWLDVHVREPWAILGGLIAALVVVAIWASTRSVFAGGFALGCAFTMVTVTVMLWISAAAPKTCQPIEESRR